MTWKQLAFSDDVLANPMTEDFDMGDTNDIVGIHDLQLGSDDATFITDSSGINYIIGMQYGPPSAVTIYGNLSLNNNKITTLLAGTAAADAIRKDQALLLDGTQAMTASLNMDQNEIDAMVFENLATAPHSGTEVQGEVYYDTADDHLHIWVA